MTTPTARIVFISPQGGGRSYALTGDQVSIGRATANDIVLKDPRASRMHLRLERKAGSWRLQDLDSANGVFVNGQRVQRAILAPGDLITIGKDVLRYEEGPDAPSRPPPINTQADLERTLASATLAMTLNNPVAPHLVVYSGGRTWTMPLLNDVVSIGRQSNNDLTLDLPRVSRRHARIERSGDAFYIRDLGSTNGTIVSGERIERERLQAGDVIRIGGAQLIFKSPVTTDNLTLVDAPSVRRRRPVVIVPGIMGSQLWLGSERVWPSVRLLFLEPDLFMWPSSKPLEPRGIVDEVVIVPNLLEQEQYGRLSAFLEESMGYQRGRDVMEFAYDWRQDVRDSAKALAQAIDAWDVQPPIDIIAHSLGTLVTRYYVEKLGGKNKVARLLLMGGPHYGAPKIITNLFSGVDLLPFGLMGERLQEVIASFQTTYQILPIYPCVHDQYGQTIDVLADESWVPEKHRPLLRTARAFRRELGDETSVPTVSIFGYGLETASGLTVERDSDGRWLSLQTEEDGGDQTVPEWSAVLEGTDVHPVEQTHGSLYVDNDVKMRLKLELMR